MSQWAVFHGDALELLRTLPSHKGGRDQWIAWLTEITKECLRVLKPGGHALFWALPKTSHWTATAVEDGGFELRDVIVHLFGSGMPKSHDASKAIDKKLGTTAQRQVFATYTAGGNAGTSTRDKGGTYGVGVANSEPVELSRTTGGSPEAQAWDGWGTGLKPSSEHWILARKPLVGTLADNLLRHGAGALNIDGCRIKTTDNLSGGAYSGSLRDKTTEWQNADRSGGQGSGFRQGIGEFIHPGGRWPPNAVFSHSPRLDWFRLRADITTEEQNETLSYFGARETVCTLLQDDSRDPVRGASPKVLFEGVCWRITTQCSESGVGNATMQTMREPFSGNTGVGPQRAPSFLFKNVSPQVLDAENSYRETPHNQLSAKNERQLPTSNNDSFIPVEGWPLHNRTRLQNGDDRDVARGVARDGSTDGPKKQLQQVRHGAPYRRSNDCWSSTTSRRDCSSQERDQDRQSRNQSGDSSARGSLPRPSPHGTQIGDLRSGEHTSADSPFYFEVVSSFIPSSWLSRFEYQTSTGCLAGACAPDCPVRVLEQQSGVLTSGKGNFKGASSDGYQPSVYSTDNRPEGQQQVAYGDTGTAARFFPRFEWSGEHDDPFLYSGKASTKEREAGCENVTPNENGRHNDHNTVKPVAFMRWAVRLVTPPGGVCLDIFCGSGTTGVACVLEDLHFMGFEAEARFVDISRARIGYWAGRRAA